MSEFTSYVAEHMTDLQACVVLAGSALALWILYDLMMSEGK